MRASEKEITESLAIVTPISTLFNISSPKVCIICGEKAIRAHAISKSKILDALAEDGKVISVFTDVTAKNLMRFGPVGTGKVSTFSAFCSKHDGSLFKSLDEEEYTKEAAQQRFMMAFRAFARANWFNITECNFTRQRLRAVKAKDIEFLNKYVGTKQVTKEHVEAWVEDNERITAQYTDLAQIIGVLVRDIENEAWESSLATFDIELPKRYPLAVSGVGTLSCDCVSPNATLPKVFSYTIFPQNDITHVIMSIPAAHKSCLQGLLEDYAEDGYEIGLTHLLTRSTTEAMGINPTYWESLGRQCRKEFAKLWYESSVHQSKMMLPRHSLFK